MNEDGEKIPREREESLCPCKSKLSYDSCCMPYHHGKAQAPTAEALMRSRYSAYFFRLVPYLVESTHPDNRSPKLKHELNKDIHNYNWAKLEILSTSKGEKEDKKGKVEFLATCYIDGEHQELYEHSRFRRHKGLWKYCDGKG